MKVSVVFTTYNSPKWLQKVLWGYSVQNYQDFDIVVADDGSTQETWEVLRAFERECVLKVQHIWQQDKGFRKCRVLNKAILQTDSEYIIFTDGDCIPRVDFVGEHVKNAEKGRYLSGSYFKLPMTTSQAITQDNILKQECFDIHWLRKNGLPRFKKTLKLRAPKVIAGVLNNITPTKCNLKGANASAWRSDLIRVNGFDERMQWGGLDRELGVRLVNAGVKPKHVRYNAVCVHLDHSRGYKNSDMVKQNRALRVRNAKEGVVETDYGIAQLLAADYIPEKPA